jgi:type II secretory pathway component HofQ
VKPHALAVIATFVAVISVTAQQKPEPAMAPPNPNTTTATPLRVHLVISKYKGEKKITSLPYTISTAAGRQSRLRIGADAPYSSTRAAVKPTPEGQASPPTQSFSYRTVGTSIDCTPAALSDGRFRLDLSISHESINYASEAMSPPVGAPVFPSFSTTSTLVLKDGETGQLTVAADPITGEVIRVDVTLTTLK